MTLKIPVTIPQGYFAMAFYYDRGTGELEALPGLYEDNSSITVVTRHFTEVTVSMIMEYLLERPLDTKFRHGINDWQFANYGSFATPGGQCAGQCITAMYYFSNPDTVQDEATGEVKGRPLFGAYDNDGNTEHKTPNFQWDDELAYKLCTKVQLADEEHSTNLSGKWTSRIIRQMTDTDDSYTFRWFAYAIHETGQPQFVNVRNKLADSHALIAYAIAIDPSEGNNPVLLVSDPNHPYPEDKSKLKKIVFDLKTKKFKPYIASEKAGQKGVKFADIIFWGQGALVDYDIVGAYWDEMVTKPESFGQDVFPEYYLEIWSDDIGAFVPLGKSHKTLEKKIKVQLRIDPAQVPEARLTVVDKNVRFLGEFDKADSAGCYVAEVELPEKDENLIGFLVEGNPKKGGEKEYSYIGFDWILFLEETELDLSQFNHCIFSWNCQAHLKNLDEENPEPQTVVRNEPSQTLVPGSFSGTTFTGERIGEDKDPYRSYTYSITAVLSNDGQSIKTATVTYSSSYGTDNYLKYKFVAHDIPIYPERTQSHYMEYRVEGAEIAKHITIDREEIKYGQQIILEKVEYLPETVCSFSFSVQPEN
jgi:hypothetical protein